MAQAQLHEVIRQLPGTVDLTVDGIDQVQFVGERLLGVQRYRERNRQGAGTLELHLGNIHHRQFPAGIALRELRHILNRARVGRRRLGDLFTGRGRRCLLVRRRGITGAQQRERTGQPQSFVQHGRLFGSGV
ncbi:hypothetical protein D9M73_170920 [compost metagenome]